MSYKNVFIFALFILLTPRVCAATPAPDGPTPVLEASYVGPAPGTNIGLGQCGVLIEVAYTAVYGDVTVNEHRFTMFVDDMTLFPFEGVFVTVDASPYEVNKNTRPFNPTGDTYVFSSPFTVEEDETVTVAYWGCIAPDAHIDNPNGVGVLQVALGYPWFDLSSPVGPAEMLEPHRYAHRVAIYR